MHSKTATRQQQQGVMKRQASTLHVKGSGSSGSATASSNNNNNSFAAANAGRPTMPTTMTTIASTHATASDPYHTNGLSERDIADFFGLHDQRQQRKRERSTLQAQQAVAAASSTVSLLNDDSGVVEVYEDDDNGDDNDAYGHHHQGHGSKSRLNPTATASNYYPRGNEEQLEESYLYLQDNMLQAQWSCLGKQLFKETILPMVGNSNNNNYASSVQGSANASFTQGGRYGTSAAPSAFVSRAGSFDELHGHGGHGGAGAGGDQSSDKPVRPKLDISASFINNETVRNTLALMAGKKQAAAGGAAADPTMAATAAAIKQKLLQSSQEEEAAEEQNRALQAQGSSILKEYRHILKEHDDRKREAAIRQQAEMLASMVPPPLTSPSLVAFKGKRKLCLFGGIGNNGCMNDTWIYDLGVQQWKKITTDTYAADHLHSSSIDSSISIKGSLGLNHSYATKNNINNNNNNFGGKKTTMGSSHTATSTFRNNPAVANLLVPQARCGHCAVSTGPNEMLMFGGNKTETMKYYNDMWSFKLEPTPQWKLLNPHGTAPVARSYAASVFYEDYFVIHSGESEKYELLRDICLYSKKQNKWLALKTIYPYPAERMLHSAVEVDGKFIITGGVSSVNNLADVWSFDLSTLCCVLLVFYCVSCFFHCNFCVNFFCT